MLEQVRIALQGKKTYFISAIAVLTAVLAWVSGEASLFEAVEAVLLATGLGTLRAGVARETAK